MLYFILSDIEDFPKPPRRIPQNRSIVHNASDGADPCVPATPLTEPLVLSRPYQVHPAPVVWLLIEEPVAIGHIAGEDVIDVEAVHDIGAIIHQFHDLTSELDTLIQPHVEQPRLLILNERGIISKAQRNRSMVYTFL